MNTHTLKLHTLQGRLYKKHQDIQGVSASIVKLQHEIDNVKALLVTLNNVIRTIENEIRIHKKDELASAPTLDWYTAGSEPYKFKVQAIRTSRRNKIRIGDDLQVCLENSSKIHAGHTLMLTGKNGKQLLHVTVRSVVATVDIITVTALNKIRTSKLIVHEAFIVGSVPVASTPSE